MRILKSHHVSGAESCLPGVPIDPSCTSKEQTALHTTEKRPSQLERVRTYIQRQAERPQEEDIVEEYRDLLRAHGIDFDERFLL